MPKRKSIPKQIQKELLDEAGYRCAIATCRVFSPLEFAHIDPVKNNGDNNFFNLIVLCSNCHSRFDKKDHKFMSIKSMINLKKNLMILNGRYSQFEIRILDWFLNSNFKEILLRDRDIDIWYLLKDGLLKWDGKKFGNALNFPSKNYILTERGQDFIDKWKKAQAMDG